MSQKLEILSINVSDAKGEVKRPVAQAVIDSRGIVGDAHAEPGHRQVSLLSQASIARFVRELGREVAPGEFAENLTVAGLQFEEVRLLDRFRFGGVELEVAQIGKACHGQGCAIFQQVGKCVMPQEGVFTRVVRGGGLAAGTTGVHLPRMLRCLVLTMSDRAAAGAYEDRSGPQVRELLGAWLESRHWRGQIDSAILPDDADRLREELIAARQGGIDVVFITGGTGIGPRDKTPEAVVSVCDKLIPGIMEHIRLKYGAEKPNALLSRSVAGVAATMQIYAMPGSVKAVEQYLAEILKTLEHAVYMLHGLDTH